MKRNITMTRDGKPKLTRREYDGEENVLCMEITGDAGIGGAVQIFVPVANESEALDWKAKIEHEDQIGAANLANAMTESGEPEHPEAHGAQSDVAAITTSAAPASSQPAPALTNEQIRASLSPEEIAAAEARSKAAVAQIRSAGIQDSWKQSAERVAGGQTPMSSTWATIIERHNKAAAHASR